MKKMKKGFTLIELLIVIAIIGILAGVVLVSTSSARTKANIAAYKSEVSGAIPGFILACDDATPAGALLNATPNHTIFVVTAASTSCGPTGNGTFTITTSPIKAGVTCGATTITPEGVTYATAC